MLSKHVLGSYPFRHRGNHQDATHHASSSKTTLAMTGLQKKLQLGRASCRPHHTAFVPFQVDWQCSTKTSVPTDKTSLPFDWHRRGRFFLGRKDTLIDQFIRDVQQRAFSSYRSTNSTHVLGQTCASNTLTCRRVKRRSSNQSSSCCACRLFMASGR
jgi:hypothetical protein